MLSGHFLLTSLLIPQLLEANPSRIVTVSGKIHEYFKLVISWYFLQMLTELCVDMYSYVVKLV